MKGQSGTARGLSALAGGVAGSPFALTAAQHGTIGIAIGAGVIVACTAIGADGIVIPMIVGRMNRHQRWALRRTRSVEDALRLDREARRTLREVIRARAHHRSPDV